MKLSVCILFLSIMVGFVGVPIAQCENMIINGVEVDEFGLPVSINSVSAPLDVPNSLTFTPPCLFRDAISVPANAYKHLGFKFKGNGAVLNECGGFGVTGNTSPNFLAFNCMSTGQFAMLNGKVPFLPERITFSPPVSSVSFKIGSSYSAGELVQAAVNKTLAIWTIPLANNMPQFTYTASGSIIKTLDFTVPEGSNACVIIIDDIQTTP
jgi:hypothetical protein